MFQIYYQYVKLHNTNKLNLYKYLKMQPYEHIKTPLKWLKNLAKNSLKQWFSLKIWTLAIIKQKDNCPSAGL